MLQITFSPKYNSSVPTLKIAAILNISAANMNKRTHTLSTKKKSKGVELWHSRVARRIRRTRVHCTSSHDGYIKFHLYFPLNRSSTVFFICLSSFARNCGCILPNYYLLRALLCPVSQQKQTRSQTKRCRPKTPLLLLHPLLRHLPHPIRLIRNRVPRHPQSHFLRLLSR